MAIIQVEHLTFSYPSGYDNVFEDVSFQIDTDWKLGFIGRNGRGKTTFFNLLMGKYEYRGKISSPVQFEYFPYPVHSPERLTEEVIEEVCPTAEAWEIMREISLLDFDCEALYRPFCTLSGGEKTKALLAALFLNEGKFLLIDEPTNHLDERARKAVAEYLKRKKSFILVSHDRSVLDGCVDHILSLNRANIEVQSGSFSSWFENFGRQQEFEQRQSERLQSDVKRLQRAAGRTAVWADRVEASKIGAADKGYVGHQSAKMMKRAKTIEARQQRAIEQKSELLKNTENESSLKLSPLHYRAERIASLSAVVPVYDGRGVCPPVSFEIGRGERIALAGKNGSGKSSILKLLCGEKLAHGGTLAIGQDVVVSYVPQDTSALSGTLTEFARLHQIDESLFKAILHKMGFDKEQFAKDISAFSGGQKKKTYLAMSLCEQAHLYVWDEPLNDIDIYSRIQIENLIKEFQPTMIFVEHDKTFRNAIATRVVWQ